MNNFKNFVIFILSCVILVQSFFIFYFLSNKSAQVKIVKSVPVRVPDREPVREEAEKPPVEQKVATKPSPSVVRGKIALVIDDWGYNFKNKDFISDNDFYYTLSILPFQPYSRHIAQLAHSKNKCVIIHMPMEPHNKDNYGLEENTLLVSMNKMKIFRLLDAAFDEVPFAEGISNHMGSRATEDARVMRIVMEYLKHKDMYFFDSLVTSKSVCRALSGKINLGFAKRDIFIDNESDPSYIRNQMYKLAAKAKRFGSAVGVGHDRPNTIEVLKEMIPKLQDEGYQFVNLSEVMKNSE